MNAFSFTYSGCRYLCGPGRGNTYVIVPDGNYDHVVAVLPERCSIEMAEAITAAVNGRDERRDSSGMVTISLKELEGLIDSAVDTETSGISSKIAREVFDLIRERQVNE